MNDTPSTYDDLAELHECRAGWLDQDADERPRPCLLCRPWLARRDRPDRPAPDPAEQKAAS